VPKQSISPKIDADLWERVHNALWHVGRGLTLTALVEAGLWDQVSKLEAEYNKGKPFPQRTGELPKAPKRKARKRPEGPS
jgi:hypothetical protein